MQLDLVIKFLALLALANDIPIMKPRFNKSVSRRSVFARRCSRDTETLVGWMIYASMERIQRASQKPSRASFEGYANALDGMAGLSRLVASALQGVLAALPHRPRASSRRGFDVGLRMAQFHRLVHSAPMVPRPRRLDHALIQPGDAHRAHRELLS